jgi:hypothetical protein
MNYLLLWLLIGSVAYNIVLTSKVFEQTKGPISFKNKMTLITIVVLSMVFGPLTFMMLRTRNK